MELSYPFKSFIYEVLRDAVVFDVSEADVLECLIDLLRDASHFFRGSCAHRLEVNDGDGELMLR